MTTSTINTFLEGIFTDYPDSRVKDAVIYSLLGGGKRLRPQMMLALVKDLKGDDSLEVASALECIHAYSLIHDDLPALDNDELRHHQLTVHRKFDEATAILAGDALLTEAFRQISLSTLSDSQKSACVRVLADAAGLTGMIRGQAMDLEDTYPNLSDLLLTYELKTGALFAAALEMACIIANHDESRATAHTLGLQIGVAFQMQDDILEYESDDQKLGKSADSDHNRDKKTILSFMTLTEAKETLTTSFKAIATMITTLVGSETALKACLETLIQRTF